MRSLALVTLLVLGSRGPGPCRAGATRPRPRERAAAPRSSTVCAPSAFEGALRLPERRPGRLPARDRRLPGLALRALPGDGRGGRGRQRGARGRRARRGRAVGVPARRARRPPPSVRILSIRPARIRVTLPATSRRRRRRPSCSPSCTMATCSRTRSLRAAVSARRRRVRARRASARSRPRAAAGAQPFPVLAGDPVDPAHRPRLCRSCPAFRSSCRSRRQVRSAASSTRRRSATSIWWCAPATSASGPACRRPRRRPPVAVAGGVARRGRRTEIPFTVIVSDGAPVAVGVPLRGPELDGIPVVVFAFADLDGDGVVGSDQRRPGRRRRQRTRAAGDRISSSGASVAVFDGGVAQGSLAVWKGAPASAGGLARRADGDGLRRPVHERSSGEHVPDGPAVATLLPFFPRSDPDRVIDAKRTRRPRPRPSVRLGVELEPAFAPPRRRPGAGHAVRAADRRLEPDHRPCRRRRGRSRGSRFVRPSVGGRGAAGRRAARRSLAAPAARCSSRSRRSTLADDGPGGAVARAARPGRRARQRHRSAAGDDGDAPRRARARDRLARHRRRPGARDGCPWRARPGSTSRSTTPGRRRLGLRRDAHRRARRRPGRDARRRVHPGRSGRRRRR